MKRKTHEEFLNEIEIKYGNEYAILERYVNKREKILVKHNKCGHFWRTTPHSLLQGHGCPECGKEKYSKKLRMNPQTFKEKFYQIPNNKIQLLEEYEKINSKIKVRCSVCNHEWFALPKNLLYCKSSCPNCYGHFKKTTKQFKEMVYNLVKTEYSVLGEYVGSKEKILMKHNFCGHEWLIQPNKFVQGRRCPKCKESHGELAIRDFLDRNHIMFKSQYKIDECKDLRPLPFDFAIFIQDKLTGLIEYQGKQHYCNIDFFGANGRFEKQQQRDNIKREYCKKQNIPLIEIPYTIKNIDNFLIEELFKINIIIEEAI